MIFTIDKTNLENTQVNYESLGLLEGYDKYLKDQESKESKEGIQSSDNYNKIFKGFLPIVSKEIQRWKTEADSGSTGKRHTALKPLSMLDNDVLAYIGLNSVCEGVRGEKQTTATAVLAAKLVKLELEAQDLSKVDPRTAKSLGVTLEKSSSKARNEKLLEKAAEKSNVTLDWGTEKLMHIGSVLVNCVLKSCSDFFITTKKSTKGKTPEYIEITEEGISILESMRKDRAWLSPKFKPMLVKPNPWTSYDTGCYKTPQLANTVKLVRTYSDEQRKLIHKAINKGEMSLALAGVNAMQETAFKIDTRILEVVKWCFENNIRPSSSFPVLAPPAKEKKVTKEEWENLSQKERILLSKNRAKILNIRSGSFRERMVLQGDLDTADTLAQADCFYLPHSMDFRGRVYPIPHFNHQRTDHIKALFRFAEEVPLGTDGDLYLMIHLANCGDFDKISKQPFDKRIEWVLQNHEQILKVSEDWKQTFDWWSKADKPFCFLQACFEYSDWINSGLGQDFVSGLPISMDGSCSGLQHFSCITRAEKEAFLVNLLARDIPGDLYSEVAQAALPLIEADAKLDTFEGKVARVILEAGFGRSEVKRNCMTYFYGSAGYGMRNQHLEDTMEPLADKVIMKELEKHPYAIVSEKTGELDDGYAAAGAMAKYVLEGVRKVAPKSAEAMAWFQKIASILAHESKSVIWQTPIGLPVVQRYPKWEHKRVKMVLFNRAVDVVDIEFDESEPTMNIFKANIRSKPTPIIDKSKARSAISPNVIHSMDASHMVISTARGKEAGINSYMMIHDSFATQAGNMGRFIKIIRASMVEMYENYCPFEEIIKKSSEVLSEEGVKKLPENFAKQEFDITKIHSALYAFA